MESKTQLKVIIGFDERDNLKLLSQVSDSGMVVLGYDIRPSVVEMVGTNFTKKDSIVYYDCYLYFSDLVEAAKISMVNGKNSIMWKVFIPDLKK